MSDSPGDALGRVVREVRIARRLSQTQVACLLREQGLSATPSYINKIELHRVTIPSSAFLVGLATVLDVDVEQLLTVAGKFDTRALQRVVAEMPELSRVLRRLSDRPIAPHQIHHLLAVLDGTVDHEQPYK